MTTCIHRCPYRYPQDQGEVGNPVCKSNEELPTLKSTFGSREEDWRRRGRQLGHTFPPSPPRLVDIDNGGQCHRERTLPVRKDLGSRGRLLTPRLVCLPPCTLHHSHCLHILNGTLPLLLHSHRPLPQADTHILPLGPGLEHKCLPPIGPPPHILAHTPLPSNRRPGNREKNAGDLETRSLCVPRGIEEERGRFSNRHPVVPQLGRNSKPGQKHEDALKALSCARTRPKQVEKKVDLSMGGCASVTAASVVLFAHVDLLARVSI